jgi:hypothetical protein
MGRFATSQTWKIKLLTGCCAVNATAAMATNMSATIRATIGIFAIPVMGSARSA